jgi:hypothetical protein
MASYKLKDIVDKTIYAKKDVRLYRIPSDTAQPYATIKAGSTVGVLYSMVYAKAGRSVDWLMFYDSNNKAYYVPVKTGTLDEALLKQQGVKTVEEQTKEKQKEEKKEAGLVSYYIEMYAPFIIGAIILVPILKQYIAKKL